MATLSLSHCTSCRQRFANSLGKISMTSMPRPLSAAVSFCKVILSPRFLRLRTSGTLRFQIPHPRPPPSRPADAHAEGHRRPSGIGGVPRRHRERAAAEEQRGDAPTGGAAEAGGRAAPTDYGEINGIAETERRRGYMALLRADGRRAARRTLALGAPRAARLPSPLSEGEADGCPASKPSAETVS